MYFPQMIKAGMVYKAIPPLYSIKQGNRNKYFVENVDYVRYIQQLFNQKYKVTSVKGADIPTKDMIKFFIRNADYNYYLESMANSYAVDPYLLEIVLNSYVTEKGKFNYKKLKKAIESKYRFMSVDEKNHCTIGTIEDSNFIPFTSKLIQDCHNILRIIEMNNQLEFKVDGEVSSIHHIMNLYEQCMPSHVQRYKGLGEMPKQDLAESTLDPNKRTLIRYTMESAKEDIELIREYESDPNKILTMIGKVTREDLLD